MSILQKTKQNLSILSKITSNPHSSELNEFISKNHDDLLNLKNVDSVPFNLLERLAPNWLIIEELKFLKDKGLVLGYEENYADLVKQIEDYETLKEEDKSFLVQFINNYKQYPELLKPIEYKLFYKVISRLSVNGFEKEIDLDFFDKQFLIDLTEEELNSYLDSLKNILHELKNKGNLLNDILLVTKPFSMKYSDLILQSYDKEVSSIELINMIKNACIVGELLTEINFENLDENKFIHNVNYLYNEYGFVFNKNNKLLKFFIPMFKEGKSVNDLNKDTLDLLNHYQTRDAYHLLISNNLKKKQFISNMNKYFNLDENGTINVNRVSFFEELNKLDSLNIINFNTLTVDDLSKLNNLFNKFNQYHKNDSYEELILLIQEYKDKLNTNEILLYILNYKEKTLNKFFFENMLEMKKDVRLNLYKMLLSLNLNSKILSNPIIVKGLNQKLTKMNNPMNLIHFYKEYEDTSLTKQSAFISMILEETPLKPFLSKDLTNDDIFFLVENMDKLDYNMTLKENKISYIHTNLEFKEYLSSMNISQEFIRKNSDAFIEFINKGNMETTKQYLYSVNNQKQKENMGLIIKAEVAGKLNDIKYNREDLRREIGFDISDNLIDSWKNEIIHKGKYTVRESSDFKTLFEMGEKPTRSCMSYEDGMYNQCLLSIFDGNKKLVTVYDKDKLVGRAILRLTKINKNGNTNKDNVLGFRDVETDEIKVNESFSNDTVILFLERLYTSYTGQQRVEIEQMIFNLIKEKSMEMNLPVYCSNQYQLLHEKDNKLFNCQESTNMFISHSKNGEQYLDSLGGSATSSRGGTFYKADLTKLLF